MHIIVAIERGSDTKDNMNGANLVVSAKFMVLSCEE